MSGPGHLRLADAGTAMSTPKKRLPEHAATQIATTLPQSQPGPGGERRTAALPHAPVPTATPHARTMTFDPYAQGPRRPMPTLMTSPQDPRPSRSAGAGRWIGGPVLAVVVGLLTMWVAGLVNAATAPPPRPHGKLRLSSDPEGAIVVIDGKAQAQATPTVIEGDVGATLRVGFKMDGYLDKEADVYVGEGEHPFRAKLERREVAPPPEEPPPEVTPTPQQPPQLAPPVTKERPRKTRERVAAAPAPVQEAPTIPAAGTGTISVHVLPWAMVYIDGAKIGQTPLDGHKVTAGLHVVELANDGVKKKEKVTIEVRANGHEEIRRDWDK